MVACPNTVGQDFHPYIVVAVFEKFRPFRKALVRLKVFKDLLPLVLAPAVIQQICFNEVHIQESRKLRTVGGYGVVLQRKGCGLFPRFFVRIITVDAEALACFGVIDGSAVVCKTIFLHCTGNIALRCGLRFFQCLIVQLIVKAVFKMVIGSDLIRSCERTSGLWLDPEHFNFFSGLLVRQNNGLMQGVQLCKLIFHLNMRDKADGDPIRRSYPLPLRHLDI